MNSGRGMSIASLVVSIVALLFTFLGLLVSCGSNRIAQEANQIAQEANRVIYQQTFQGLSCEPGSSRLVGYVRGAEGEWVVRVAASTTVILRNATDVPITLECFSLDYKSNILSLSGLNWNPPCLGEDGSDALIFVGLDEELKAVPLVIPRHVEWTVPIFVVDEIYLSSNDSYDEIVDILEKGLNSGSSLRWRLIFEDGQILYIDVPLEEIETEVLDGR